MSWNSHNLKLLQPCLVAIQRIWIFSCFLVCTDVWWTGVLGAAPQQIHLNWDGASLLSIRLNTVLSELSCCLASASIASSKNGEKTKKPRQNGFNFIHTSCICFYLFLALLFCHLAGQSFGEVALSAWHVVSSFLMSIGVMDKHRSEVAKTSRDIRSQIQSHSYFSCKARSPDLKQRCLKVWKLKKTRFFQSWILLWQAILLPKGSHSQSAALKGNFKCRKS